MPKYDLFKLASRNADVPERERHRNPERDASVEVKGLENDVVTRGLCFSLQTNSKGATFDLHQQHTGTKCQRMPVLDKKQGRFNSAAASAPPSAILDDPRAGFPFGLFMGSGGCWGEGGEQGGGADEGGRGLKGRGPGGEEERGFSALGSGQMAREWRRRPADSAASTGRNAFLFPALSQSGGTQTSAVKQWIKSHIPPIISL